jgi:hypothetical protein
VGLLRAVGALLLFAALFGVIVLLPISLWVLGAINGDGRLMLLGLVVCVVGCYFWHLVSTRISRNNTSGPPFGI